MRIGFGMRCEKVLFDCTGSGGAWLCEDVPRLGLKNTVRKGKRSFVGFERLLGGAFTFGKAFSFWWRSNTQAGVWEISRSGVSDITSYGSNAMSSPVSTFHILEL